LNRQSSSTLTVAEGSRSTMSNHPLSEDYLRWLGSQIRGEDDGHPDRTYDGLLAIMYEKEFVWLIPNDDNRVGDGLALRVDFCANGWAWVLMHNLELHRITDPVGRAKARRANAILDKCIWRTYESNGRGGFFPLMWPDENQVHVELWYQMSAYINEQEERR
jgi:hypothetical protein